MKKIVFIAIAAIAFTTATQAQDSSAMKERMQKEESMRKHQPAMMSELNLTPDQQAKMKQLREDNRTKMEAIQNNTSLGDDQKQEQMKSLRIEQRKSMEAVLTDEQKTKWKEVRKDEMMHHHDMKAGGDSTMHR